MNLCCLKVRFLLPITFTPGREGLAEGSRCHLTIMHQVNSATTGGIFWRFFLPREKMVGPWAELLLETAGAWRG